MEHSGQRLWEFWIHFIFLHRWLKMFLLLEPQLRLCIQNLSDHEFEHEEKALWPWNGCITTTPLFSWAVLLRGSGLPGCFLIERWAVSLWTSNPPRGIWLVNNLYDVNNANASGLFFFKCVMLRGNRLKLVRSAIFVPSKWPAELNQIRS